MNENADEIVSKLKMHALEDTCRICDAYIMNAAATLIESLQAQLADARNELCQKCGNYKRAHLGYCDGCRWKENQNER